MSRHEMNASLSYRMVGHFLFLPGNTHEVLRFMRNLSQQSSDFTQWQQGLCERPLFHLEGDVLDNRLALDF